MVWEGVKQELEGSSMVAHAVTSAQAISRTSILDEELPRGYPKLHIA
jgi:hypothetical protein